jgi:hypothetical protein
MRWLTCSLICSLSSIGKVPPERVEFSLLTFSIVANLFLYLLRILQLSGRVFDLSVHFY